MSLLSFSLILEEVSEKYRISLRDFFEVLDIFTNIRL